MTTAIRVYNGLFGPHPNVAGLKAGDLIACCNFLEFIRGQQDDPTMQLYLADEVIFPGHTIILRDWLEEHTDYVTTSPTKLVELNVIPGTDPTYSTMYNIWNIREDVLCRKQSVFDIPDAVRIPSLPMKSKIVLAPLMDADYNHERNWSLQYTQNLIKSCLWFQPTYEWILVSKEPIIGLELGPFVYSHNYKENLNHIREAKVYIGGDTGLSHFAGSIDSSMCREYHYSKSTYGTTNPLNWKSNGSMVYY